MDCDKCKKPLGDCECPDIDEKLTGLRNNPNFIYKMCLKCEKHYERCMCDEPKWGTSHDDTTLEEALNLPKLGDVVRNPALKNRIKMSTSQAESDKVERKMLAAGCVEEDLANAPPEIQEAVKRLGLSGVGVKIYKGDEQELSKILGEKRSFKSEANQFDQMQYEAFTKAGGKPS